VSRPEALYKRHRRTEDIEIALPWAGSQQHGLRTRSEDEDGSTTKRNNSYFWGFSFLSKVFRRGGKTLFPEFLRRGKKALFPELGL